MTIRIVDNPDDPDTRTMVAEWSVSEWSRAFPADTVQTYLDLFEAADADPRLLPAVLVARSEDGIVGTASLVVDDELPGATEPGPWVAAVFVRPADRGKGVGASLVGAAVDRARDLGFERVYLYTETGAEWYERMGWQRVRVATLAGSAVTVLTRTTNL